MNAVQQLQDRAVVQHELRREVRNMERTSMMSYDETMAWGAAQYADVLRLLDGRGLPATFVQTGGMNAAIEVQLEAGTTLLVTDAEDALSWARVEHQGWWVGLYAPGEHDDGPLVYDQVDGNDVEALLALIGDVVSRHAQTHTDTDTGTGAESGPGGDVQ